jgi:hypothetical protein
MKSSHPVGTHDLLCHTGDEKMKILLTVQIGSPIVLCAYPLIALSCAALAQENAMMQARTPRSLRLPVMRCLTVRCRCLTKSQYLTHRKAPLPREITRSPVMAAQRCCRTDMLARYTRMIGPQTWGLTTRYTWPVQTWPPHLLSLWGAMPTRERLADSSHGHYRVGLRT